MQAVLLTGPKSLVVAFIPPPSAGEGEAVVKLSAAGICGTDLHGWHGNNPLLELPRIPGHELAGTVVFGGELKPGTPVAINPMLTCGQCRACRVGRRNCCVNMRVLGVHIDGGFRPRIAVPASMLHPLPENVPLEVGALVEPLSIGANACLRGEVAAGQAVVVYGAGAIGLCCLLIAKARGARVMSVDAVPGRLALAEQLGADETVDLRLINDEAAIAEWTDGEGPDVIIEATGRVATVRRALELVGPAGIVVTLAISREAVSLPVTDLLVRKELDLRASRLNRDLFDEVIKLLAEGQVDPTPLITHRFPLAQAALAFQQLDERPAETVKVLLTMDED